MTQREILDKANITTIGAVIAACPSCKRYNLIVGMQGKHVLVKKNTGGMDMGSMEPHHCFMCPYCKLVFTVDEGYAAGLRLKEKEEKGKSGENKVQKT